MKWTKKVAMGMSLISEGCAENKEWKECCECPFDSWCSSLWDYKNSNTTPTLTPDWKKDIVNGMEEKE